MPLKTDAEKEGKDLAKKYKVTGYPTILFIDSKGEVVAKIGGYMPPEAFSTEMGKAIAAHKELPGILAKLKASPNDGEANAKMAGISATRGKIDEALAALGKAEKAGYKGAALAPACNAVGDHYQTAGEFDKAIGYFKKADAASTNVNDRAYAQVSIMYCHLSKGDRAAAKATAKVLVALKGAPADYVKMAQDVLGGG